MLWIPAALLVGALLTWLPATLALIGWRRSAGAHWTERARRLHPARVLRAQGSWLVTGNFVLATALFWPEAAGAGPWIACWVGTILGGYPIDRAVYPDIRWRTWLHYTLAGAVMQAGVLAVILLALHFMPRQFGPRAWLVGGLACAVHLAWLFGFALAALRAVRLLRPAGPRVLAIVAKASAAAAVRPRRTWELRSLLANAFAFVTTRELIFTDPLIAISTDEELEAICAHELGHLSESRAVLVGRVAGALLWLPLIFYRPVLGDFGTTGFCLLGIAFMLAWWGVRILAHRMEKRADRIAGASVVDPANYARALERLYRFNQMPAVMKKTTGSVHPDLYDRMVAAGMTPDYPRPAAPASMMMVTMLFSVPLGIMAALLFGKA